MKNKFKISFLTYLLTFSIYSQEYLVRFLDISQGLSNNSVTCIYQERQGYIWFGTNDGLNRYDGYNFKVYRNDVNKKNSIAANYIFCIDGDSQGNIWVGSANGGSVLNSISGQVSQLAIGSSTKLIKEESIVQIKAFSTSCMMAACEKSGLVIFKKGQYTGKQADLNIRGKKLLQYHVTSIEPVPEKGFCWIFIKNHGLYKYWIKSQLMEAICSEKLQANYLKSEDNGSLWIGTDEGLFKFDEKHKSYGDNILDYKAIVTNILFDKNKEIYVATDGSGVFKINKQNKAVQFKDAGDQQILKSDAVWGLYEDKDKNKWFGTLRGGVSMIGNSKRCFRHIKNIGGNPALNYTLSFCEDANHNLWIGTDGGGLRFWNRAKNTFTKFTENDGLSSNFIPGIVLDGTYLWVATWDGGLNKINTLNRKVEHYNLYNPVTKHKERSIWFVFKDSKNIIWSATKEGTLYYRNPLSKKFEVFDSGISGVLCISESSDGHLWVGNYTDLIEINTVTKKINRTKIGYPIRCILEDKKSNFWIGTSEGGLLKFNRKNKSFTRFTIIEGLPSNIVLRILEDKKGYLWLSTYKGISKFNPEKKKFHNFTASDGLQSNQFSYNAGLILSSGEFIFGGINGFNIFFPGSIKEINRHYKVLLDDVQVNNNSVLGNMNYFKIKSGDQKILKLPFDQTTLSLDFVALDYENTDKIKYAYYLEGWDEHWNYVSNRNARYSRLYEGTYQFKVKTTDNYGNWGKKITLIEIQVLPPWHRSWWAYMLYILAGAGVVFMYIRHNKSKERMRYEVKLAQMENRKEKEFSEKQISMFTYISHEFRTPLSLIINPIKKIIKQQNKTGEVSPELLVANRNARRLLSLMDQLLLFRRAENDADQLVLSEINLNKLCDEVYQYFTQQAKSRKIKYDILLPQETVYIIGDNEKIEISLFNIVSNAFKYTLAEGEILLSLESNNEEAIIKIKDTGVGISEDEIDNIYDKFRQINFNNSPGKGFGIGLFVVKHFIEKHFGYINCSSRIGEGTEFKIFLKKGRDHFSDLPLTDHSVKMSRIVKELAAETVYNQKNTGFSKDTDINILSKLKDDVVSEKKSILIIDDNEEIRNYLMELFSDDYLTYSAENGFDGYEMVNKILPDLVLSDISMEGLNGLELCKKIKSSEGINHILVILLTASSNPETQLQGISDGADDYITKPFDDDILKAKVETLLRNRSQLKNYFLDSITLNPHTQKVPTETADFLKKCIEVIEKNLANQQFNIKQFSIEMGMSHTRLYTKIKEISGQTLNGFIRSVRLRRAAVLLLTEDIRISHAASQVGMEDVKHFREQFVKLYGMTPSEFIKKYRNSFNSELNIIQKL